MIPLYDENKIKNKFPFGTLILVLANILVFFYTFQNINSYSDIFGFRPADLWNGQFYTIFTAMFLHANLWHLLGNMLFLWVFGENLESKLGTIRFILFYLICGVIASIAYALIGSGGGLTVIGASGAISGILGGYLILFPKNKIKSIIPIVFFWTLATLPAGIFIIIWFLYQFFSLGFENMTLIAYSAHIAGFIAGLILIKKFASRKKLF
jgi:membrane associated rhomboid family serine protease